LVVTKGEQVRHKNDFHGLDVFVAERGSALLATAIFLAGSRVAGEDLLQAALERLMRRWERVRGDPEGYLRRVMYNLAVDHWRSRRRRPEVLAEAEMESYVDGIDHLDLRRVLMQALAALPPRQRVVLVLRYWEELTEAETAAALGCSPGTVKSSASRGLARLRDLTADAWAPDDLVTKNGAAR